MYREKYDVTVVGGGFAGCAAALASARTGAKTLIVERMNFLGGAPGTMYINPFMAYETEMPDGSTKKLSAGIFGEIVDLMTEMGGCDGHIIDKEILKLIWDRKMAEADVDVLFDSTLVKAYREGDAVRSIDVVNKSGIQNIASDYFIDATGDADLAVSAGFPTRLGRPDDRLCQPMTLCFFVAGIDDEVFQLNRREIRKKWLEEKEKGYIRNPMDNIMITKTVHKGIYTMNATRVVKRNPTDPWDISVSNIEAREQMFELLEFYRKFIPGCENARILSSAPVTGVRESRMIDGEYILDVDELKDCVKFEDSIACGNYDIDIHNPEGSGTSHYFFENGTYYTIPYRSLIPKNSENLLVAGRCISVTHEVQASIRIMPIVCTIGEGAGTAAALASASKKNVGDIDIGNLRDILRKNGACID